MRIVKWIVPALALALVVSLTARAEESAATGTVKGVVYQADGTTPVAEAKVALKANKAGKKKAGELAEDGAKTAAPALSAVTDASGAFSISAPAGEYTIMAHGKGQGQAKETVTISAGETTELKLTLQKKEGGAKDGAGKEGGAAKEGKKKDKEMH